MNPELNPLISVVMPVYNTRDFLQNSIRNIVEDQFSELTESQWELVIVDDGSTDGSHLEVEPWINRFPESIKLIRTLNQGVSTARNIGLSAAKGDYVYFVDSDDLLAKHSLIRICQQIQACQPDILHFQYKTINTEQYNLWVDNAPESLIQNGELKDITAIAEQTIGFTQPQSQWAVWQNVYRIRFLIDNKLMFSENLTIGEDAVFFWQTMMCAKKFVYSPDIVYFYHERKDSVFHSKLTLRNTVARLDYIDAMTSISHQLQLTGFGEGTLFGINCNLRETARQVITEGIICNELSFSLCWKFLQRLYRNNLCRIGLTRFRPKRVHLSIRQRLYRFFIAYFIMPAIKFTNRA